MKKQKLLMKSTVVDNMYKKNRKCVEFENFNPIKYVI